MFFCYKHFVTILEMGRFLDETQREYALKNTDDLQYIEQRITNSVQMVYLILETYLIEVVEIF